MRVYCLLLTLLVAAGSATGQTILNGTVVDEKGQPAKGVAVSLLNPTDSTMEYFGITNSHGTYEMRAASSGNFLLQAAGVGFRTYYNKLQLPLATGKIPAIVLAGRGATQLDSVTITAEKVPILLKKDTVEYNAGSFKTKPDAVTEDLLRKLPGVEVDKAGNIKAHGKDVQKVLVDGKEFFGDDPKVATKNLPADAIDKVQVYDALSDASLFTGVDDGSRDKTINLVLKNNKRKGYFGDVEAGYGTDDRYKLSAKLYRFQKKTQFAMLGMMNNINQFGFSFQDYLSFKGGLSSLSDGDQQFGSRPPVNFGGAEPGFITSGAAGLNYTYEPKPGRRYNISYLGNGADKQLDQGSTSWNFTGTETLVRSDETNAENKDFNNRLSASIRHDLDTMNQLRFRLSASYSANNAASRLLSSTAVNDVLLNRFNSQLYNDANGANADATLGWVRKMKGSWPVFNLSVNGSGSKTLSKLSWDNGTFYPATTTLVTDQEFQHNDRSRLRYGAFTSLMRDLGKGFMLTPEVRAGYDYDMLDRKQGPKGQESTPTDSLSLHFDRVYQWLRPGLSLQHNTSVHQLNLALRAEEGWLQPSGMTAARSWTYWLPSLSWQYFYSGGKSVNLMYVSAVSAPAARQMLPVTDFSNAVERVHGNPLLRPEYTQSAYAGWRNFDQFNFTSMSAGLQAAYTKDKINYARRINTDGSEDISYANMADDYSCSANASYNTPIRPLGLNVGITLKENYIRGQNIVNDVLNINSSFTHSGRLTISNRHQDKWTAELELDGDLTNARYSVQESLNSSFLHYGANAQLSYKPSAAFYFSFSADMDRYTSRTFSDAVFIPLLKASATYYFLKGHRGALSIDGFDLLDQNRNIYRVSKLNYLLEERSNIIGRYFMLSFKYRLSHAGGRSPMRININ